MGQPTSRVSSPTLAGKPAKTSLGAHGDCGVDAGGAGGGDPAGDDPDRGHQGGDAEERGGVVGRDAEEEALDDAEGEGGAGKAQNEAGGQKHAAFLQDHPLDADGAGPEAHADADLVGARADREGEYAGNADGGDG